MFKVVLGFLVFGSLAFGAGPRFRFPIEGDRSHVEFLAVGNPSAIKIRGEMTENPKDALKGEITLEDFKAKGTVTLKLDSLTTGIALRDKHMKEKYLETGKYPFARLEITDLLFPRSFIEAAFSAEGEPFKGLLTLREKTLPVVGTVSLKGTRGGFVMKFEFKIKCSAFKIETPSFMGVTVADEVKIEAETKTVAEKAS